MGGRGGSSHGGAGGIPGNLSKAYNYFRSAYGAQHARNIVDILSRAPQNMQDLFERFAHKFDSTPLRPDEPINKSYFSQRDLSVHLNIDYVATRPDKLPYETLFHEYGHMIDYITGRADGSEHVGASFVSGLGKIAQAEMNRTLDRIVELYGEKGITATREKAANALIRMIAKENTKDGKLNEHAIHAISDIMGGAGIGKSKPLGWGHDETYWKQFERTRYGRDYGLGAEIYAHLTGDSIANSESLAVVKKYFPRTYKKYIETIERKK